MAVPNIEDFYAEVYNVVRQIPAGRVLSYGRIAELIGWPNHARLVGRAMHDAPLALNLPCHRVVNSAGRTVPGWHQQATSKPTAVLICHLTSGCRNRRTLRPTPTTIFLIFLRLSVQILWQ